MKGQVQKGNRGLNLSGGGEEVRFHYSREERLKKLRGLTEPRRMGLFSKKRRRGLLIIFLDLVLIAAVMYLITRPVNLFLQKQVGNRLYELNVTSIKGKKVLIGFTIKNQGEERMELSGSPPVVVKIYPEKVDPLVFQKPLDQYTALFTGESSSTIFIIDEARLPGRARLELRRHSS